jgi:mono/diheme cytochrome c family protein
MRTRLLILACATGFMMVPVPGYGAEPDVGRGKATYGELCAKCHGSSGKGDGKEAATLATKPKDLTDCARMAGFDDDKLFQVIKSGGPAGGLSKDMPGYADALEDDEMRDVLAYIRSLCRK